MLIQICTKQLLKLFFFPPNSLLDLLILSYLLFDAEPVAAHVTLRA